MPSFPGHSAHPPEGFSPITRQEFPSSPHTIPHLRWPASKLNFWLEAPCFKCAPLLGISPRSARRRLRQRRVVASPKANGGCAGKRHQGCMISPLPRSAAGAAPPARQRSRRRRRWRRAVARAPPPAGRRAGGGVFETCDPSAHSKQHFALRQLLGVSSRPVGRFSSVLFSPYGGACNLSNSSILKVFCDVH